MTLRMVARVKAPFGDPKKKGNRLFVMSVGTRAERFEESKYNGPKGSGDWPLGTYYGVFLDEPQIIEARSEADARRKMVRNGWGRKHFECLGVYDSAEEAEECHDEHWPPCDDGEEE